MLIKNEFDFWRNKLDTYTQVIDDEEIIYLTEIPFESLSKILSPVPSHLNKIIYTIS